MRQSWFKNGSEGCILAFVSSPTTVRKPERDSSSGSSGTSLFKTPTSMVSAWPRETSSFQRPPSAGPSAQNALITKALEMASKSKSM